MANLSLEEIKKLTYIFAHENNQKVNELISNKIKLAHYTTAENAISILKQKELWLRNARAMDDFTEVTYGYNQLKLYFDDPAKLSNFTNALGAGHPAIANGIRIFNTWLNDTHNSTYISCFSEHDQMDNDHGRLSMWRGFSRNKSGVALIFNPPSPQSAIPLNIFLTPVDYSDINGLTLSLNNLINRIKQNQAYLITQPHNLISDWIYIALITFAVSLKHTGFKEEREWRMIYHPTQRQSNFIHPVTVTINNVPQLIYKIELINDPKNNINNIEIANILSSIIIGPTQYPIPIYDALIHELINANILNPHNYIKHSGIPIRTY